MNNFKNNYPVDKPGSVDIHKRSFDEHNQMPNSKPNGGIYGGKHSTKPWASIHIIPTATNLIHNNLKSANPPPEATTQYIGSNRLGNNYIGMPGVKWYNPNNKQGEFLIKGL